MKNTSASHAEKQYIVILWTCRSEKEARNIIDRLIRYRMIACANIVKNIQSIGVVA